MSEGKVVWLPLESNPDVMNKYLHAMGVPTKWQTCDVVGLDSDLLAILPQPVLAIMLLFPVTEKYEARSKRESERTAKENVPPVGSLYFMKQTVSNACGTVALIHAVANNRDRIDLEEGPLKKFLQDTANLSYDERAATLMEYEAIAAVHRESAQQGQTDVPSLNDTPSGHFVCFVNREGRLYELDGRVDVPVDHGPSDPELFTTKAAEICRQIMSENPEELRFTVVALTAADE